jgi:antitoxin component YwqK of YwqJK toxin-antitoxin module
LEGLRSGRGKEYDSNGRLLYSGNFEQDLYSGEGTLYYKDLRK